MKTPATDAWLALIGDISSFGCASQPRGMKCFELLQKSISVDMRMPIVMSRARSLSYRFMGAEAFWILTGDDKVETIAPYNSKISQFSDDGKTFFGAYGPRFVLQLDYVVNKLCEDPHTRQAGMTFWRQNPPATKDVPCTVSIFFTARENNPIDDDILLHAHVFMRSSDAWLGFPYDVFNFSMMAHLVCAHINQRGERSFKGREYKPGTLFMTMANSHLYEHNISMASECLKEGPPLGGAGTPPSMYLYSSSLYETLVFMTRGQVKSVEDMHDLEING